MVYSELNLNETPLSDVERIIVRKINDLEEIDQLLQYVQPLTNIPRSADLAYADARLALNNAMSSACLAIMQAREQGEPLSFVSSHLEADLREAEYTGIEYITLRVRKYPNANLQ